MMVPLYFTLLVGFVSGQRMSLEFTKNSSKLEAKTYGKTVAPITYEEAELFGLIPNEQCLKKLELAFGKTPDHCYLGWRNEAQLFSAFNFDVVTSEYRVDAVTQLKHEIKTVAYKHRTCDNNSTFMQFAKIVQSKPSSINTITHKNVGEQMMPIRVSMDVWLYGLPGDDGDAGKSYYEHALGRDQMKAFEKTQTIVNTNEMEVPAHTTVNETSFASEETFTYEITYVNTLRGLVVADYSNKYKDHHYWSTSAARLVGGPKFYKEIIEICIMNASTITIVVT